MSHKQRQLSVKETLDLLAGLSSPACTVSLLQGVLFPARVKWRVSEVRGATFDQVAFGGAMISGSFFRRGVFRNCTFRTVDLDDLRIRKIDFIESRFENVCFGKKYLGLVEDVNFADCVISRSQLEHVSFISSTFSNCDLNQIGAKHAKWKRCVFVNTKISGTVESTNFIDSTFRASDFSAAELRDCVILSSLEDDVKLPDRPDNFAVMPGIFHQAEAILGQTLDMEAMAVYRSHADYYKQLGPRVIISDELFDRLAPFDRDKVIETLYQLRAE